MKATDHLGYSLVNEDAAYVEKFPYRTPFYWNCDLTNNPPMLCDYIEGEGYWVCRI